MIKKVKLIDPVTNSVDSIMYARSDTTTKLRSNPDTVFITNGLSNDKLYFYECSGGKVRMGSITKQGSKWLRWILVECALHAIRKSDHYHDLYTRVAHKHGNGTARVAVARSMLRALYAMLRFNRPYQERQLRPAPWGHNLKKGSEI